MTYRMILASAFVLVSGTALADEAPKEPPRATPADAEAQPGAEAPADATPSAATSEAGAAPSEQKPAAAPPSDAAKTSEGSSEESSSERPDAIRFRGGFLFEGGPLIGSVGLGGGAVSPGVPTAIVGVQLSHLFGITYTNRPLLMLLSGGGALGVAVADQNVVSASFTFADTLEVAAGAGLDYYAGAACGLGNCSVGQIIAPGLEAKVAAHLGGWGGNDPGRVGFTVAATLHASIVPESGQVIVGPLFGLGASWF